MFAPEVVVNFDPEDGIVRCMLKGVLTMATLEYYEREVMKAVNEARQRSVHTRMLFDASNGVVQPADIVARLQSFGPKIRRPGDRLAVIVASVLVKMQAERTLRADAGERTFASMEEAEIWLRS